MSLQLDERRKSMLAEMGLASFIFSPGAPGAPGAPELPAAAPRTAAPAPTVLAPVQVAAPQPRPVQQPNARADEIAQMEWGALAQAVAGCRACSLCESRRNTVFGTGDQRADWLIVGEAPGENEDLQGAPFVGPAGKLLDNMLKSLGLDRQHKVYIANVLKCRPPGNRNPSLQEVSLCEPFLRRQVQLLQPRIVLAMGRFAVQSLLGSTEPIGKLRGQAHQFMGVPVVVTYHPAYLLRSLPDKAKAWADLCLAQALLSAQTDSKDQG